jgi:hypothetical protein
MENLKKHQIILIFLLFAISFFTYFPAITANFATLDDLAIIADTNKIPELTIPNVFKIFTKDHLGLYHPLVTLSFSVERYFFGLVPAFYHVNNMLLHILSTILVFLIFRRIAKSFAVTYIITTLFAIHPMHVEVVAWISARKDTLYSVFYLMSILMYIKTYDKKNIKTLITISSFCFLLACFSKAMAVTLPLVLMLIDYLHNRFSIKKLKIYIPYIIISLVFIAVGIWSHYRNDIGHTFVFLTLIKNILNAHFHVLFYIYKFILPVNLYCMYHPFYNQHFLPPWYIFISPLIVYGMILFVFLSLRKTKKLFFGFMFFLVVLVPSSGILPIGIAPVADRYIYLAYIGLFYLFAELSIFAYNKTVRSFKIILIVFAIIFGIILTYLSFNRSVDWQKEKFGPPGGQPSGYEKTTYSSNMPEVIKAMEFDRRNKLMQTLIAQQHKSHN